MSDKRIMDVAAEAEMIVGGYAFTKDSGMIRVLNLNNPEKAMVLSKDGTMLESNMDDIEQALVLRHWSRNSCFMESADA